MEESIHSLGTEGLFQGRKPISMGWRVSAAHQRWQSASEVTISQSARNLQVDWDSQEPLSHWWSSPGSAAVLLLSSSRDDPSAVTALEVSWKIPDLMASTRALPGAAPVGVVGLDRLKVLLQLMLHHGSLAVTQEVSAVLFTSLPAPPFKSFLTKGSLNACIDSWLCSAKYPHVAETWRFFKAA